MSYRSGKKPVAIPFQTEKQCFGLGQLKSITIFTTVAIPMAMLIESEQVVSVEGMVVTLCK